jgi:uncharacterized protein YutE (UPF0331/DUF86 family)
MTREAIEKHLQLIEAALERLREKQALSKEQFLSDPTSQAAVAHWIQQAVESCVKLGLAFITEKKLKSTGSYKGVFLTLHRHGFLTETLKDRLTTLAAFRNLLVHVYWDVDPEKVYQSLQENLADIEEFAEIGYSMLLHE